MKRLLLVLAMLILTPTVADAGRRYRYYGGYRPYYRPYAVRYAGGFYAPYGPRVYGPPVYARRVYVAPAPVFVSPGYYGFGPYGW